MFGLKVKLFHFISPVSSEIFMNFGGKEEHLFEFWSWALEIIWNLNDRWGPPVNDAHDILAPDLLG
jgi:hypothetical protein